jgi:hypothetical protein
MSKDMAEKVGKLEDRLRSRLGKLVEVNKDELERKKTALLKHPELSVLHHTYDV